MPDEKSDRVDSLLEQADMAMALFKDTLLELRSLNDEATQPVDYDAIAAYANTTDQMRKQHKMAQRKNSKTPTFSEFLEEMRTPRGKPKP